MSELSECFNRHYLNLSLFELRNTDISGDAGRLPYNSTLYLDLIAFNPGCTSTQLAEMLGVTKATVTVTVNRLVKRGLVERERSAMDGRIRYLRLSERVSEVYSIISGMLERISTGLEMRYTPEEIALFRRMLDDASDMVGVLSANRSRR